MAVPAVVGVGDARLLRQLGIDLLHGEETAPVDAHRVVAVARALDVDAAQARGICGLDDVHGVDVLPGVVRGVIGFAMRLAGDEGVHQLARGEGAGEVVVGLRLGEGSPAFHRAVLVGDGDAQVLGVFDDGGEDLLVEGEVLLKAMVLTAKAVVVADEGSGDNIGGVAAQQVGDADEAQEVVAVGHGLLLVVVEEVLVGPDGDAEVELAADVDDLLRVLGLECLVVQMRGDMILAGAVAAEYAEFKPLCAEGACFLHNAVEIEFLICRGH